MAVSDFFCTFVSVIKIIISMESTIEIKRIDGSIIFRYKAEDNTTKKTIKEYIKREREKGKERVNLNFANLSFVNLNNTDLSDVDLINADLRYIDLRDSDLIGANLSNADLSGANLRNANLMGTNVNDTIFIDSHIEGTILYNNNYD